MKRTTDRAYVNSVILDPSVRPWVVDDSCGPDWEPPMGGAFHWLRPDDGGAAFCVYQVDTVLWEVHSAVLRAFRRNSLEYVKDVREWLRQNTPCKCLITKIVAGNYPAARLAEAIGMQKVGTLHKSRLRGGTLVDQSLYELEI